MSNLILSVIAIALAVIVVFMGIYYGGSIFNTYQNQARASRLVNESEQLIGALQVYRAEVNTALPAGTSMQFLVTSEHLSQIPDSLQSNLNNWVRTGDGLFVQQQIGDTSSASVLDTCQRAREAVNTVYMTGGVSGGKQKIKACGEYDSSGVLTGVWYSESLSGVTYGTGEGANNSIGVASPRDPCCCVMAAPGDCPGQ